MLPLLFDAVFPSEFFATLGLLSRDRDVLSVREVRDVLGGLLAVGLSAVVAVADSDVDALTIVSSDVGLLIAIRCFTQ